MMRATLSAALALLDGVGVVLAALMLGYHRQHRVTGPALMLHLCDQGRQLGYRHYFYGGGEGVADRLARRLGDRFEGLQIVGACSPPFTTLSAAQDHAMVAQINATRPDILWVGLGCPKQEKWMLAHAGQIEAPAMIGVGAAFDFHSGAIKWAPRWIRQCGMEWLYRLAKDPRRMWRRNVYGMHFAGMVVQESMERFLWPTAVGIARNLAQFPVRDLPDAAPMLRITEESSPIAAQKAA